MENLILTKEALLVKLKACADLHDPEAAHGEADDLLTQYINDAEITEAYDRIPKWYA